MDTHDANDLLGNESAAEQEYQAAGLARGGPSQLQGAQCLVEVVIDGRWALVDYSRRIYYLTDLYRIKVTPDARVTNNVSITQLKKRIIG